jgi:hypothetical protein
LQYAPRFLTDSRAGEEKTSLSTTKKTRSRQMPAHGEQLNLRAFAISTLLAIIAIIAIVAEDILRVIIRFFIDITVAYIKLFFRFYIDLLRRLLN